MKDAVISAWLGGMNTLAVVGLTVQMITSGVTVLGVALLLLNLYCIARSIAAIRRDQ